MNSLRGLCRTSSRRLPFRCVRPFSSPANNESLPSVYAPQLPSLDTSPPEKEPTRIQLRVPPQDDPTLSYITLFIMRNGRRSQASRMTSRMLLHIHALTRAPPLPIVHEAIKLASPAVATVQVSSRSSKVLIRPVALSEKARARYALKWIFESSKLRSGKTVEERAAREMIAVLQGTSKALDSKVAMHKRAMLNRYVYPHIISSHSCTDNAIRGNIMKR